MRYSMLTFYRLAYRISTYTAVWNSLNYACCTFPVTSVDPMQDLPYGRTDFLSKADQRNWELCECNSPLGYVLLFAMLNAAIASDNPETFQNAPVALQLVGQMLEEEAVLGMTEIVDEALKTYKNTAKARL